MFRKNTVFVIGAGASAEAGLPAGYELAQRIIRLVDVQRRDSDDDFVRILTRHAGDNRILSAYVEAGKRIVEGLPSSRSIDRYIDRDDHDEYVKVLGKAAIVYSLLRAEQNSHLQPKGKSTRIDRALLDESWYPEFEYLLFDGVQLSRVEHIFDNISIVCFNYDRCIEHFLTDALIHAYHLTHPQASQQVTRLKVLRPYGSLGALIDTAKGRGVKFGEDVYGVDIFGLAKGIRTFNEQIEDQDALEEIRRTIAGASTLVFLGFGFHPSNIAFIHPGRETHMRRILATGYELSDPVREDVRDSLWQLARNRTGGPGYSTLVETSPTTTVTRLGCYDFFREYGALL